MLYKKSSRSSLLDSDIYGLLRFVGPMVCRTIGDRTNGVSDQWCVGPMVCRTNGQSPSSVASLYQLYATHMSANTVHISVASVL